MLGDDDDFDDDIKWLGDDDGRTALVGIALQLNGHAQGNGIKHRAFHFVGQEVL